MALVPRVLARLQEPSDQAVVKQYEMFGEGDSIREHPALVREGIEMLPDATLQAIQEVGHVPWLGAPEQCGELVAGFLGERRET